MHYTKSRVHELLVKLYLRLNGYFTAGFIVHSDLKDCIFTELDILAVRFPYSSEPEREITSAPELEVSDRRIDFIICEVKSGLKNSPQFNAPLRNDPYALASVLRRLGCISHKDVFQVAEDFRKKLKPAAMAGVKFPTIHYGSTIQIRGVLFATSKINRNPAQAPFIYGKQILAYIYTCLCPIEGRPKCSTRYDYEMWGEPELVNLVRYFKERKGQGPGLIQDLDEKMVS